eukprot:m.11928 g.11928  ORF g.11928 m.11928 type:complete len:1026 (-) comp5999_c0_seq2:148-3225(-)
MAWLLLRQQGRQRQQQQHGLWLLSAMASGAAAALSLYVSQRQQQQSIVAAAADEVLQPDDDRPDWQRVLRKAVPAVVALHVHATRAFDTQLPGNTQGSGFVVDKERGIILTNRHVLKHGPATAEALFANHEEVPVRVVYRDPVHDFAFARFDPKRLRHMQLEELKLMPQNAKVGTEVRIVGNNAGEKLSILSGTLARLDRAAPHTGLGEDFNTFYIQAASSSSGGSSGSPVIDITGSAVALNAAGKTGSAVNFYLPLDRVTRALSYVQKGEQVPRGDLQTVFVHQTFNYLSRLGLPAAQEARVRATHPNATGMLVVHETVPEGPAHNLLEPGDILLTVNGESILDFVSLESILDDSVGKEVSVGVARGARNLQLKIKVQDLHSTEPSQFLEVGDCVFNDLSYHVAKGHNVPVGGVFVAQSGYMLKHAGVPRGSIVTRVAGVPTPNLVEFARVLASLKNREPVTVRVCNVQRKENEANVVMYMDRLWFPFRMSWWDSVTGTWPSTEFKPTSEACVAALPVSGSTRFPHGNNKVEARLAPSLLAVRFTMPYPVDSLQPAAYVGSGLVVDAARGLVVVDRETVPNSLGDVQLTVAGSLQIPAKVVFVHPVHNLAVLQYDPKLIGDTPVQAAKFSDKLPKPAQSAWLVGLNGNAREGFYLFSAHGKIGPERQTKGQFSNTFNLDAVMVQGVSANHDGVVVDDEGHVVAFMASFKSMSGSVFMGIPGEILQEIVRPLQEDRQPALRGLGVRLEYLGLAEVRHMGMDGQTAEELERLAEAQTGRRQALVVGQRWYGTSAYTQLKDGDVLLSVDGEWVLTCRDVSRIVQNKERVVVKVNRDGQVLEVPVDTVDLVDHKPLGTDDLVLWSGAVLQAPTPVHRWIWGARRGCVLVSAAESGSPAQLCGLEGAIIQEIDGMPTPTLEAFTRIVANLRSGDTVRIKFFKLQTQKVGVTTLKVDQDFFPGQRLRLGSDGLWSRTALADSDAELSGKKQAAAEDLASLDSMVAEGVAVIDARDGAEEGGEASEGNVTV